MGFDRGGQATEKRIGGLAMSNKFTKITPEQLAGQLGISSEQMSAFSEYVKSDEFKLQSAQQVQEQIARQFAPPEIPEFTPYAKLQFEILHKLNQLLESQPKEKVLVPDGADTQKADTPLIFLSHSSSDKKYGDALQKVIMSLGVKRDQLIYTSHHLHGVRFDAKIFEYLRKNIYRDIFMIILWSDEYLESPACLNEMGAGWVIQCDYSNVFVPTFNFANPKFHECAVDTSKKGAVLNGSSQCKTDILELIEKILSLFNLEIDTATKISLLDEFTKEIMEDTHNGQA